MPFQIEMTLTGVSEAIAKLDALDRGRDAIKRKALVEAARLIRDKARELCPVETKTLRKALGVWSFIIRNKHTVVVRVGPRIGKGQTVTLEPDRYWRMMPKGSRRAVNFLNVNPSRLVMYRDAVRYAHFLEFGTKHRAARPFLRPAMEAVRSAVETKFIEAVNREIAKL